MPDWGMWYMSVKVKEVAMTELDWLDYMWNGVEVKRCSGHHGYWVCGEDYPDHMVPVGEFNAVVTTKSGLDGRCRRCLKYRNSFSNSKNNPRSNAVSARAYTIAGGSKAFYELPKVERIALRDKVREDKQWNEELRGHLLNTAPAEEVLAFIRSRKSEFGQSKPMTRRQTIHVAGEKVDEGWVYVFKVYTYLENHPGVHWVYKIGKTYPDGISNRISESRTFARSDFIDKFWFEKAEMSEKEVHAILRRFNLRALGYTNCGKELFMCSLEQAVSAINEVEKIGNTKEQAVG